MAGPGAGRLASPLSSVSFQLVLNLRTVYFVFYFFLTLGVIIRKSLVLSYLYLLFVYGLDGLLAIITSKRLASNK